jgi:hypothetical protein
MLIVAEISEAMEGERKNPFAKGELDGAAAYSQRQWRPTRAPPNWHPLSRRRTRNSGGASDRGPLPLVPLLARLRRYGAGQSAKALPDYFRR